MPSQSDRHLPTIVGDNIKGARDAAGLTQRELGEQIGVEGMFISRWERGAHLPSRKYLPLLAAALFDGDISALYRDEERQAA